MAEPGLTEVATTSLRRRSGKIQNNTLNNNPILYRMNKVGNVEKNVTGRTIVEEFDYQENGSYIRYEGSDLLNTTQTPVLSSYEYNWKQSAVSIGMNGLEQVQNGGDAASLKLFAQRVANAERTIKNMTESDIRSDGTASGGKQIGGLDLLLAEDPTTGTVGGVNRATSAIARNAVNATAAAITVSTIENEMRSLMTTTYRDGDTNRLWVLGGTLWNLLSEVNTNRQRYVDKELADLGFDNLKFDGVTCVLGGGYQAGGTSATAITADKGYLLNLDSIKLKIGKGRFFEQLSERESVNQDATIRFLVFCGNLCCSNFGLQGLLYDNS